MAKATAIAQFKVSNSVQRQGYAGTIDGKNIMIPKGVNVAQPDGTILFQPAMEFLTDLSDEQIRQLTLAGVITLTPEQNAEYKGVLHPN